VGRGWVTEEQQESQPAKFSDLKRNEKPRRAPGCATPTGFAGHASATTASQLTFHLGHSVGADHDTDEMPRREPAKWIYRSR